MSISNKNQNLGRLFALLMIALSMTFLSILMNIYLHEQGHYLVADHFGLNPSIHFSSQNNSEESVFNFLLSRDFRAYVTFDAFCEDHVNLLVTLAGPIVNLLIALTLFLVYGFSINKLKKDNHRYEKYFGYFILADTIFISILVPSILSFLINMAPITGSDGAAIYEILSKLFLK